MCIVIAGMGTACPTRNELRVSCINNPDGFGWAIVSDKGSGIRDLTVNKGMLDSAIIDSFLETMAALGDTVVAWTFHARIFTHGAVSIANTHPFYLGDDELTIVAHNGILPVEIDNGDTRSDSRIFAEDYLPAVGGVKAHNSRHLSGLIEGFVYGSNSKVVVLTANPEADYALTIFGESSGHWRDNEIWFSNHSYEPARSYSAVGNTSWSNHTNKYNEYTAGGFAADLASVKANLLTDSEAAIAEKFTRCSDVNCRALVSEFDDYCPTCDCCQMCERGSKDCMCYTPSTKAVLKTGGW